MVLAYLVTQVAPPGLAVVWGPVRLPVSGEVAAGAVLLPADVAAVLLGPGGTENTLGGSSEVRQLQAVLLSQSHR